MNQSEWLDSVDGEYDDYEAKVVAECPYCDAKNFTPEHDVNPYCDGTTEYVWYETHMVCGECGECFIVNAGRLDA
jgi:hypothetical protein